MEKETNKSSKGPMDREVVSPLFQTICIFISSIILSLGFYIRGAYFRTIDEPIHPESVTPETLKRFGGFPEYVSVGLHIDRFQDFDVTKNLFQFTGSLWFEFNAGAISLATLESFQFERATIIYLSKPETKLIGNRLFARYLIRVSYSSGLIFSDFPLDDHRINLVLTHPFISPNEVIFDSTAADFSFDGNLFPFGWKVNGLSVRSGYEVSHMAENSVNKIVMQPVVAFSMDIERYGSRFTLTILLPILIIYFLMFFALTVDVLTSVTITLGGITGILAYRYVIEQLSPLSGDLMLSDYFFFLFLSSAVIIFLFNKIDIFMANLNLSVKKICIGIIHIFTLMTALYLLLP